ncbi:hypothetical protein D806_066870 [Mycolicibacterium smegmatis MKD8]|uniref:Uncharacterized protein n=1 Tax=Mycolicibacterium smegmatis (strain MKD8) TaxID=1214915 RepID=A0A2U9Q0M6_MYCSE|nr:hypothetical protein D806_066870 [Mycolicibacterium smegmatis MKD8]
MILLATANGEKGNPAAVSAFADLHIVVRYTPLYALRL